RSETNWRPHLKTSSLGALLVTADGHIEDLNPKVEQIFGYRREELVGQALEILLPERFRAAHAAARRKYFSNPGHWSLAEGLELTGERKDGKEFPVDIALRYASSNSNAFAIAYIVDISARKKVEQQLHQARKFESLGVLAAGVAHN